MPTDSQMPGDRTKARRRPHKPVKAVSVGITFRLEFTMIVRWYVLAHGEGFRVLREAKPHGQHEMKQRALDAAVFMATIEANKQGHVGEVFAEDSAGRMTQHLAIAPRKQPALQDEEPLSLRQVGFDQVLMAV